MPYLERRYCPLDTGEADITITKRQRILKPTLGVVTPVLQVPVKYFSKWATDGSL